MAAKLTRGSPWRRGALERIDEHYARLLAEGFPTADFDGQPGPETLQCRNELDRTNWIGLLIKCLAARDSGFGEAPINPPIRCTSNRMYAVSHLDAIDRMFALLEQVGAAQANHWRLKDAVRNAETLAELNGLDLDEGWPS